MKNITLEANIRDGFGSMVTVKIMSDHHQISRDLDDLVYLILRIRKELT